MSASFSNQTIAQIELYGHPEIYENKVYICRRSSTRRSPGLHLDALGVRLTELSEEQASYLGLPQNGPFKPEHYRY